ncbi:MAG: DUF6115 domain-containing protein [Betaproteobacteria bacterium]
MDSLVLSQVPWDVLAAVAVIVAGILFIVFSLGMTLGERRAAQAVPAPNGRDGRGGRGKRGGRDRAANAEDPARLGDAAGEVTRAIEEAAARAIQDLEAKAGAATRLLAEAEARIMQLTEAVAALEREAKPADRPEPAASTTPEAARAEVGGAGAGQDAAGGLRVTEKHALVLRLADQGLTLSEIARRAGIGRGEAQLILDLYGKQCLTNPSGTCAGPRDEQPH